MHLNGSINLDHSRSHRRNTVSPREPPKERIHNDPAPVADALIAATALSHDMVLLRIPVGYADG